MVSSTRQAIACVLALFSVALVAYAQSSPSNSQGATVSGRVTVKGKGEPGIAVILQRSNTSTREYSGPRAVTDEQGNYRIVNVPPGNYQISPAARVLTSQDSSDSNRFLFINKNETIENVNFALVPGGVITGKILDSEGRPVIDQPVEVLAADNNQPVASFFYFTTDDRGVYRVYGLRPGNYRVAAGRNEGWPQTGPSRPYKRTYYPFADDPQQATLVEVSEGSETKDIDITLTRLTSQFSASGRVIDGENGEPLANFYYSLVRYTEHGSSSHSGGSTVTNSKGEFRLENLQPGKYGISISTFRDSNSRFEEAKFEIVDQDVRDLVIKASKGGSISGVVVLERVEGKAARAALNLGWVMGSLENGPGRQQGVSSQIGEDGSFKLNGLAAGAVTIGVGNLQLDHIERDGVIQPNNVVMLKDQEELKGVRIVVQYGTASLRGRIEVENGSFPAGGRFEIATRRIDASPNEPRYGNAGPSVDSRGHFLIERLLPGTYEIMAAVVFESGKAAFIKRQQLVITAGSTNTINIIVDLSLPPLRP